MEKRIHSSGFRLRIFLCFAVPILLSGCAVHYYDKDTGTDHLWGFGHLKMKAEPSKDGVVRAVVTGTEMVGLNVSVGEEHRGIGIGYDNRQKAVVHDDASVNLQWPSNSIPWSLNLFDANFGSTPPWITNLNEQHSIQKLIKEIQHEED